MVKTPYIGDGHPTFNRNPYNWYINPYYWVDEFIPYYTEIMGVDRPWHISTVAHKNRPWIPYKSPKIRVFLTKQPTVMGPLENLLNT